MGNKIEVLDSEVRVFCDKGVVLLDRSSYVELENFGAELFIGKSQPNYLFVMMRWSSPRQFAVLARHLLDAPPDLLVDHRNGNPFDNHLSNLRLATYLQNSRNTRTRKNKSGYRGVTPYGKLWQASVTVEGSRVLIGRNFLTAEEAARAYDIEVLRLFGEFSRLNFPNDKD